MDKEASNRSEQILDMAAQRRREKQVVDVEVEKTLIVVFHLHEHPSTVIRDADRRSVPGGRRAGPSSGVELPVVGEGIYGLPAAAVESIVPVEQITYVPGTPAWILGVVNVRGEIESVLDLKAVLGFDQAELTPESRLLIAQEGDLRSGLLVDQVVDIVEMPAAAIGLPPTPLEGGKGVYIAGETEYADQTLVILNLSEIFHRALETDRV